MDEAFMESYLRWLGQASDAELLQRRETVAVALLQACIESELSRLLSGLLDEEIGVRRDVQRLRERRRHAEEWTDGDTDGRS